MVIYPAIDLRDGKCVRLYKGDFATTKVYNDNPLAMLEEFASAGSEWVHMVDLDGAKAGQFMQLDLIRELVSKTSLKIEVGGGIRDTSDIEKLFSAGVSRAVVGSVCVTKPELVNQWINDYGADRIVLALDCALDTNGIPKVRTHGWQQESHFSVYDILDNYPSAKYVLCTDVGVDGTLAGPSIALYRQIQNHYPELSLIASGGVGKLADITDLRQLDVHGVVVGKALYENQFTLTEALAAAK
ncbi:1-(5-phosphoribosyl)-5-[(5-phosphoribosylamino)methylideneamino]imidazole-4-carboxamide isomerase [Aquella oligotrophica]|uniref:1-(5-phosphoribosyl)-5-[(5-phosphoribosylamino)methylideneamino] imidazole-4-carboxamide isomerase n=1 Tax=Aquella oligotrophica TaxID=2067065 RepID=A0A2I7N5F1_9NEIS|nr:1-(5-phosphoribosyl)-5-[(5-phosphoribosylamino)methylideneamino]imidazole-4-carboxamide isomerase [Aquella oligotrophica]AUR51694.1 1-(5-phosphoribosyl)-5-[(5-phosphoribosylamino)methylideneamino]imidazole-4-carboxamide isomerase [Aquella oligotrophica]